eukprot:scaffold229666_cov29-Attheya_sp.AAC.1
MLGPRTYNRVSIAAAADWVLLLSRRRKRMGRETAGRVGIIAGRQKAGLDIGPQMRQGIHERSVLGTVLRIRLRIMIRIHLGWRSDSRLSL